MKTLVPNYYKSFKCTASSCRHTCCRGWEIDVDGDKLSSYMKDPEIAPYIVAGDEPHFKLLPGETCPFLNEEGLCRLIIRSGEDILCNICRDHPRFRNFWADRTEIGLGLVCEQAGRIILSYPEPLCLEAIEDNGEEEEIPWDEEWLSELRDRMLAGVKASGPLARLEEYLIFRHLSNALYDDRVEERVAFIRAAVAEIKSLWEKTDMSLEALIEICRVWSYDVEYDDEVLEERISDSK